MLLTGFDAPVAQVMYLDKPLKEHNLLQAIARVNRPFEDKNHGLIVDYYGVSNDLKEALAMFSEEDVERAMVPSKTSNRTSKQHTERQSRFSMIWTKWNRVFRHWSRRHSDQFQQRIQAVLEAYGHRASPIRWPTHTNAIWLVSAPSTAEQKSDTETTR